MIGDQRQNQILVAASLTKLDMIAQRSARWAENREVPGSSPARD